MKSLDVALGGPAVVREHFTPGADINIKPRLHGDTQCHDDV